MSDNHNKTEIVAEANALIRRAEERHGNELGFIDDEMPALAMVLAAGVLVHRAAQQTRWQKLAILQEILSRAEDEDPLASLQKCLDDKEPTLTVVE